MSAPPPDSYADRVRQTKKIKAYDKLAEKYGIKEGMRKSFTCPLSKKLMVDPVVMSDTHTYDREAITEYIKTNHVSPVTGEPFSDLDMMVENKNMKLAMSQLELV